MPNKRKRSDEQSFEVNLSPAAEQAVQILSSVQNQAQQGPDETESYLFKKRCEFLEKQILRLKKQLEDELMVSHSERTISGELLQANMDLINKHRQLQATSAGYLRETQTLREALAASSASAEGNQVANKELATQIDDLTVLNTQNKDTIKTLQSSLEKTKISLDTAGVEWGRSRAENAALVQQNNQLTASVAAANRNVVVLQMSTASMMQVNRLLSSERSVVLAENQRVKVAESIAKEALGTEKKKTASLEKKLDHTSAELKRAEERIERLNVQLLMEQQKNQQLQAQRQQHSRPLIAPPPTNELEEAFKKAGEYATRLEVQRRQNLIMMRAARTRARDADAPIAHAQTQPTRPLYGYLATSTTTTTVGASTQERGTLGNAQASQCTSPVLHIPQSRPTSQTHPAATVQPSTHPKRPS